MRHVAVRAPGGADQLAILDAPLPTLAAGEVLIDVAYAGVNRPDIAQRAGHYPPPSDASPILGLEVSGTVAARAPDVTTWNVGDRVCSLVAGGGYAEYCAAPASWCMRLPPKVSLAEAAGVPENYFTVWYNLVERVGLKSGESVLIHGGSSGIGLAAIQLAHALGATVLTTAGSEDKCRASEARGARRGINYRTEDFVEVVREVTGGRGVDVVLEHVGGRVFEQSLAAVADGGRVVVCGGHAGEVVDLDLIELFRHELSVIGCARATEAELRHVIELVGRGELTPVVSETLDLADAARAHKLMEDRRQFGKLVLIP